VLAIFLSGPVRRRPVQPADSTRSIPAARATIYYQAYIGQDAALYNGVAYQQNYRDLEGDPYFESANLKTGAVTYENITYSHIPSSMISSTTSWLSPIKQPAAHPGRKQTPVLQLR